MKISALRLIVWLPCAICLLWTTVSAATAAQTEFKISAGTRFETPCYVQDSGVPGPTVVISGGVHGDEPAGACAAEQIRSWPIKRGKLVVIPRANPPALAAGTRLIPGLDQTLSNLARDFPKAKQPNRAQGPAAPIWEVVEKYHPAWLIDLHEGALHKPDPKCKDVGSTLIVFPSPEADRAAQVMLDAINATIPEEPEKFIKVAPPVDGSLSRAAGEHLGAHAMTEETTNFVQPLALRAWQHKLLISRLLIHLDMIDPGLDIGKPTDCPPALDQTQATVRPGRKVLKRHGRGRN